MEEQWKNRNIRNNLMNRFQITVIINKIIFKLYPCFTCISSQIDFIAS